MRKLLIFIIVFYLGLLLLSFNISSAQENFKFTNIFDYLKNLILSNKSNNLSLPESSESLFQSVSEYKPVIDYENLITQTIEKISPAVVSIIISKNVPIFEKYYSNPFEDDDFIPPEFREFFKFEIPQYRQKGTEKRQVGAGTGFIISTDGLIATNKHVVSDEKAEYTIFFNDGRKFTGKVIAVHPRDDLALIKINAKNLPTIPLGDSNKIKLGQTVIAIGNALGEFQNTVSVGVVSGLRRAITASDDRGNIERIEDLIQTDAAINPGNSGGPLINLRGEVIGINTAIVSGAQNIGFAIPINRLKRMINEVTTKGKVEIPYLGVRYLLITEEVKNKFNLPFDYGAYIYSDNPKEPAVIPNSPAEKAGLKEKDIILELDNQKITPQNSLAYLITNREVNSVVNLKILREDKTITLQVKLEKLPTELENQ